MLTADLVRPRLRCTAGELAIALLDEHKRSWLQTASELIALLRRLVGHTRAEWEQAVDGYAGPRVDYVVVRGLHAPADAAAARRPARAALCPRPGLPDAPVVSPPDPRRGGGERGRGAGPGRGAGRGHALRRPARRVHTPGRGTTVDPRRPAGPL